MSLEVKEPPKWEAKTRPKTTGPREYSVEISHETFKKLYWLVKGLNAANSDSPDKITVSGQAETILREWLDQNHIMLTQFWDRHIGAEEEAIRHVAAARTGGPHE